MRLRTNKGYIQGEDVRLVDRHGQVDKLIRVMER